MPGCRSTDDYANSFIKEMALSPIKYLCLG